MLRTRDQTLKQARRQVALAPRRLLETGVVFEVKDPGGEVMASGIRIYYRVQTLFHLALYA